MEAQAQVLWNFLANAYRAGLIDESLQLAERIIPPTADLGDLLARFEDAMVAADFASFERRWGATIAPALTALDDPRVLASLRALLAALRPVLEAAAARGGPLEQLVKLWPELAVLAPRLTRIAVPHLETFLQEQAGRLAGQGATALLSAINRTAARRPETVTRFFGDFFGALDRDALKGAADMVLEHVLAQKPQVFRWALATVSARLKKRLMRARRV